MVLFLRHTSVEMLRHPVWKESVSIALPVELVYQWLRTLPVVPVSLTTESRWDNLSANPLFFKELLICTDKITSFGLVRVKLI